MRNCPSCQESIISQTPSKITSSKCGSDCPEDIICPDLFPSGCVFYSGTTLPCTGITNGDTVTQVLTKIDNRYGVRVTSNDNCCGYLSDKIVSDTITSEIVVVEGCQKLKLEATAGNCEELEWIDLNLENPFINGGNIDWTVGDTTVFDFGEGQEVQYALDPCNGKVWLRGIIEVPSGITLNDYTQLVVTLPNPPAKTRMFPVFLCALGSGGFWSTFIINTSGEVYLVTPLINAAIASVPAWLSFDGFSYEI